MEFAGKATRILSNSRFIAIATSAPLAIHILSSTTFLPIPSSPLLDLSSNPFDGSPVFDLGQGGRFLAYATTRRLGNPSFSTTAKAGTGIRSRPGMFDTDDEDEVGNVSNVWIDKVGGEVARKVGEAAFVGARALGGIPNYWKGEGSEHHKSVRQAKDSDGIVIIIDMLSPSPLKAVAHFRCTTNALAHLSLSRSSSFILSACSLGRSIEIFELRPNVAVGRSSQRSGWTNLAAVGKVYHRYRLNRGLQNGRILSARWSDDARFVTIGTERTHHVFAIQPYGGILSTSLEKHLSASKVVNAQDLVPLSVTLSPISQIHRSPWNDTDNEILPHILIFVAKSQSFASTFSPSTSSTLSTPASSQTRHSPQSNTIPLSPTAVPSAAFNDCLIFDPTTGNIILTRLATCSAPLSVEVAASRVVSGLSKLMNNRGASTISRTEVVSVTQKAEWNLVKQQSEVNVYPLLMDTRLDAVAPQFTRSVILSSPLEKLLTKTLHIQICG
jgi:hypothetical protein